MVVPKHSRPKPERAAVQKRGHCDGDPLSILLNSKSIVLERLNSANLRAFALAGYWSYEVEDAESKEPSLAANKNPVREDHRSCHMARRYGALGKRISPKRRKLRVVAPGLCSCTLGIQLSHDRRPATRSCAGIDCRRIRRWA